MRILKNSMLNIAGYLIPGLLSIPVLGYMSRVLGVEEFGYLSIIMALVGYASIFDVGITRSVIREIAIYKHDNIIIVKILSTSSLVVVFLGILASIIIILSSNIITSFLKVSPYVFDDFICSLKIVSVSIPIFLLIQVFSSIIEGKQEFVRLNIFKTISGILVVLLPAFALFIQKSLTYAVIGLLISRILSFFLILYFIRPYKLNFAFDNAVFKRLLNFGGWIAISNIISPIMSYFDRFILSNHIGGNLVGYYTAPSEAIARLAIVPTAITRTIFPMMSENVISQNLTVKKQAYLLLFVTMIPIGFMFIYFAPDIITLWLGKDFAIKSVSIFQVLILGFMFNAFAQVPFTSIQAKGFSKITAGIHLFEFIPYLVLLILLVNAFGLIGAAWAWTIRMFIDLIILLIFDFK